MSFFIFIGVEKNISASLATSNIYRTDFWKWYFFSQCHQNLENHNTITFKVIIRIFSNTKAFVHFNKDWQWKLIIKKSKNMRIPSKIGLSYLRRLNIMQITTWNTKNAKYDFRSKTFSFTITLVKKLSPMKTRYKINSTDGFRLFILQYRLLFRISGLQLIGLVSSVAESSSL